MCVPNITNDSNGCNNTEFIHDENDDNNNNIKVLLISIPGSVLLQTITGLMIWSTLKLLFSQQLNLG